MGDYPPITLGGPLAMRESLERECDRLDRIADELGVAILSVPGDESAARVQQLMDIVRRYRVGILELRAQLDAMDEGHRPTS